MPQDTLPYSASCNPSRRAKQPNAPSINSSTTTTMASNTSQRAIIPSPSSSDGSEFDPSPARAPTKRGRKPGPLSRAARETQRKLNHSIIEKARRTKINEALASLRQLVPSDYGYPPQPEAEQEEGDEMNGKRKDGKGKGKREEKEKEFKLEILVRTVSFLQDLLARVEVLEARGTPAVCTKCALPSPVASISAPAVDNEEGNMDRLKVARKRKRSVDSSKSEHGDYHAGKRIAPEPQAPVSTQSRERLPSISSWLPDPDSHIDPQLLDSPSQFGISGSGLPSPPSSTQFAPQSHPLLASVVPTLHLGASSLPSPNSSLNSAPRSGNPTYNPRPSPSSEGSIYRTPLLSPRRTPEDESAASLLLQISGASPLMGPTGVAYDMSTMRTKCVTPITGDAEAGIARVQAQTPGSMLGLVGRRA
ncbi:hypothetical protein H0H87_008878 [Tephrocybe sp. NHM501043]|nr:hypothetical protein H0H87_008878 [Tephrocybe sp. NHM501043]